MSENEQETTPAAKEPIVGLNVEIEGEHLVIRVGIDGLVIGAHEGPMWPKLRVLDRECFARCVAKEIRNGEDESGATQLTRMLDAAIEAVVEDGEECVSYDEDFIPE